MDTCPVDPLCVHPCSTTFGFSQVAATEGPHAVGEGSPGTASRAGAQLSLGVREAPGGAMPGGVLMGEESRVWSFMSEDNTQRSEVAWQTWAPTAGLEA